MNKTLDLIKKDGEVRELTSKDMGSFKSKEEILPTSLIQKIKAHTNEHSPKKSD